MTYGQMVANIVKFKLGEGEGRFLRDADPQTADTLNFYWAAFGPHGSHPAKHCIDDLFARVEEGVEAGRVA